MTSNSGLPAAGSSTGAASTAPTPNGDFSAFVDNLKNALETITSAADAFPDKSDLSFHRTLDRKFAKGMDETSARVLKLADQLLQLSMEGQEAKGKGKSSKARRRLEDEDDVVDSFRASVVEVTDGLLEDADSNLDELNGQKKKAAIEVKPAFVAQAGAKLPGPASLLSKTRLPAEMILAPIPKPQLQFRDKVNNSPDVPVWVPQLTTKPHAMVPLGFHIEAVEDVPMNGTPQEIARFERAERSKLHPYYYETRHLPYPTSMFEISEPQRPKSFEDTPFEFVDTPEQLEQLVNELLKVKEIAVDLEHHSTRSYHGITCLMQISTRNADWIIDTLALRAELRDGKLGNVFADPSIVKVFHGADSDITWLQRDFDLYIVNLFDTYHATKVLEHPQFSLSSLLQLYCDFEPDKRYQMADWRIRPLPQEMMYYARSDTHFLLFIYDSLRNALIARSSRTPTPVDSADAKPNPQRAIREVLERSAETALKLYQSEGYDRMGGKGANGWLGLSKKMRGKNVMDIQMGWVFKALHEWRDQLARKLDESPHYVLPNHTLTQLATLRPKNVAVLGRTIMHSAPMVSGHEKEMLKVIKDAADAWDVASNGGRIIPEPTHVPDFSSHTAASAAAPPVQAASKPKVQPKVEPKVAAVSVAPRTADVWADLVTGKVSAASVAASKPGSALFGNTLTPPTTAAAPSAPASSLFGNTLAPAKAARSRDDSPGFGAVQASIYADLEPRKGEAEPHSGSDIDSEPESGVHQPAEAIGRVNRPNAQSEVSEHAASSDSASDGESDAAAAPPATTAPKKALVNADGVVMVKKKKTKKAKAAPSAVSGDAESVPAGETEPKPKKKKIKAEDIPMFDYATESNLLDKPRKPPAPATKKGKKTTPAKGQAKDGKKKTPVVDTSAFRRPPSDPSQPKSGNRSQTFLN